MNLDVKTIFIADALTTALISLALFFYSKTYKTYPGFKHWTTGSLAASLAFAAAAFRGIIPEWTSILLVNGTSVFAFIVRLDGVARFVQGKTVNRFLYAIVPLEMVLAGFFYFVHDSIDIRLAMITACACPCIWWIAAIFLHASIRKKKPFYSIAGIIAMIYGTTSLIRTTFWFLDSPVGLFDNTLYSAAFFLSVLAFEVWFGLLFLMMNSRRLEEELVAGEKALKEQVVRLNNAMSEVKVLKGLLPICSSCKKIRDDDGYWTQLEAYIDRHSEATFTHGVCPECAAKMKIEYDKASRRAKERTSSDPEFPGPCATGPSDGTASL